MNQQNRQPNTDSHSYGNGSTNPPKKRGGLLALLLIAVIFLSGLSSALGFLNIRLTKILASVPTSPVTFSHNSNRENSLSQDFIGDADNVTQWEILGIAGEAVPEIYQQYYSLPQGICITSITPNSIAQTVGLQVGDILQTVDNIPVSTAEALTNALSAHPVNQELVLTIQREGSQLHLAFLLPEQ